MTMPLVFDHTRLSRRSATPAGGLQPGDYLSDGRELYCVEEVIGERALIEDCRSGALIEIGVPALRRLNVVKRSPRPSREASAPIGQ